MNLYRIEINENQKNIVSIKKKKELLDDLNDLFKNYISPFTPFTKADVLEINDEEYFLQLSNKYNKLIVKLYKINLSYSQNSFLSLGSNSCYLPKEKENCYPSNNGIDCQSKTIYCTKIITKKN